MRHISKYLEDRAPQRLVLKSGYDFIDDELGGYHSGELMTICGVENSGKTAFIISQIDRLAVEQKIPTLVDTGLMDVSMFVASMMAYHYDIATNDLWNLWNNPLYKDIIKEYEEMLNEAPIYMIYDDQREDDWEEELRNIIIEKGIRMVFMNDDDFLSNDLMAKLKRLAMETGVSIIRTWTVWSERGNDGFHISLADFNSKSYSALSSMSDTIIAFNDFDFMKICVDERGVDLRGVLGVEIIKQKGCINKTRYRLQKRRLYFREYYSDKFSM